MELNNYLDFVVELNEHLKKNNGDIQTFGSHEFNDNEIEFHREKNPDGTSFNFVSTGENKTYFGAVEVEYFNSTPVIFLRLPTYCVFYDGNYGYVNKMREMAKSPIYEFSTVKTHVKYCNDLDDSTSFQYKLVEDNIDNILTLVKLLREMVETDKYDSIVKAPLRVQNNVQ